MHHVVLVDRERDHVFAPALLWLMVGQHTAEAISRDAALSNRRRQKRASTAAEMLAERGFDARSLAGGMKAWSLAWNAAEVRETFHANVQAWVGAAQTGRCEALVRERV